MQFDAMLQLIKCRQMKYETTARFVKPTVYLN